MNPLHGDDALVLTLGSGDTLRVHEIGLFQAPAVEKVATLRAEASALLGSSQGGGIGLLGTPSVSFNTGASFPLQSRMRPLSARVVTAHELPHSPKPLKLNAFKQLNLLSS